MWCQEETTYVTWLQNGSKLHMWLWLAITISLDKNEDEKCSHIIQQLVAFNDRWKYSCFVINDVVHKWLITMWHFIQLQLWLQIIVANVHVSKCEKNML